jgi:hypothetical protein
VERDGSVCPVSTGALSLETRETDRRAVIGKLFLDIFLHGIDTISVVYRSTRDCEICPGVHTYGTPLYLVQLACKSVVI